MATRSAVFIGLALLGAVACGPPPGMPPSPTNPPVKPPPPQTSDWDGEIIGADRKAPADTLAVSPQVVVRPGDEQPVRVEPSPGWWVDENGVPHYSNAERERMIGTPSAASGTWEVENGVRVFRPARKAGPREQAPSLSTGGD